MTTKDKDEKRGVPDYRKPIKQTTDLMKKERVRKELKSLIETWPEGEGLERLLDLLTAGEQEKVAKRGLGGTKTEWKPRRGRPADDLIIELQQRRLSWLASQPSEQEPQKNKSASSSSSSSALWRRMKSLDIVAFNEGAENSFVAWLTEVLEKEEFGVLPVAWVVSNAAFELNLSTITIKRYILKWTSDRAPFTAVAGQIRIREKTEKGAKPDYEN